MKRFALAAALILAGCASDARPRGPVFNTAQPGEVIAAELAFARLAQERGQWTAFRETATEDAEMFVPQRVNAQQWLRGRADPARSVTWQPHAVWSSCDGSYAVTRGRWQNAASSGGFVTVWQRQQRGGYKWVLDMSIADEQVDHADPDTIAASVADCRGALPQPPNDTALPDWDLRFGVSNDRSLIWKSVVKSDNTREFALIVRRGTTYETALYLSGNSQ